MTVKSTLMVSRTLEMHQKRGALMHGITLQTKNALLNYLMLLSIILQLGNVIIRFQDTYFSKKSIKDSGLLLF